MAHDFGNDFWGPNMAQRDYSDDDLRNSLDFPVSVKAALLKSCADQKFKERLLSKPTETLRGEGHALAADVGVEVVQDTDTIVHLVLPFNRLATERELSDADLASVTGGAKRRPGSRNDYS